MNLHRTPAISTVSSFPVKSRLLIFISGVSLIFWMIYVHIWLPRLFYRSTRCCILGRTAEMNISLRFGASNSGFHSKNKVETEARINQFLLYFSSIFLMCSDSCCN